MNQPKFEEIYDFKNLLNSAKKAMKSRWLYRREIAEFRVNMGEELLKIKQDLIEGKYQPQPYRNFTIRDPKERMISAAPIRDRVVHHALISVIGIWLEKNFIDDTYACQVGKGSHKAIQQAQNFSRKYNYFVHHDVKKFFDSIDHRILLKILSQNIQDVKIMNLLEIIIHHSSPNMASGKSVPIGNLTSQYFGNLYLSSLDHFIKGELSINGYLRYMDDFLIFHEDKETLKNISNLVTIFIENELLLKLAPNFIHPIFSGIPFLGLRIFPYRLRLQPSRWKKFKEKFKSIQFQLQQNQISYEHFIESIASMISHLDYADSYYFRGNFIEQNMFNKWGKSN